MNSDCGLQQRFHSGQVLIILRMVLSCFYPSEREEKHMPQHLLTVGCCFCYRNLNDYLKEKAPKGFKDVPRHFPARDSFLVLMKMNCNVLMGGFNQKTYTFFHFIPQEPCMAEKEKCRMRAITYEYKGRQESRPTHYTALLMLMWISCVAKQCCYSRHLQSMLTSVPYKRILKVYASMN